MHVLHCIRSTLDERKIPTTSTTMETPGAEEAVEETSAGIDEAEQISSEVLPDRQDSQGEEEEEDEEETEAAAEETEAAVEADAQGDEEHSSIKLTNLPIGRIRKIIKTDPDVSLINQEAVFLITKATEYFIDSLAKESYKYTVQAKKKTIQKHDVQSAVDNVDALMFLDGV